MKAIKAIGGLPKPIQLLIRSFLDDPTISGDADPAIMEMTEAELNTLADEEDIVFQLILDRKYKKWYLIAVGEYTRMRRTELILPPDKMMIRRSIIAFAPVDDSWIRSKRREALKHKMISEHTAEYQEDVGFRWV